MKTNKITPEVLAEAKSIGQTAFLDGIGQAPYQCAKLLTLIDKLGLNIGQGGVEVMKAYVSGWHEACDFWCIDLQTINN